MIEFSPSFSVSHAMLHFKSKNGALQHPSIEVGAVYTETSQLEIIRTAEL